MLHKGERGQNLILFALALPVLLGMLALGLDGGYGYAQRQRMQTAADAAALAGARALALGMNYAQVQTTIQHYATNNGADTFTWSILGFDQGIQVDTQTTWNTFFAGLLGIPTMTASASAVASIDFLYTAGSLLPIAVYEQDFIYEQTYTLWDNGMEAPGSFGWLDWDGVPCPAGGLADDIANPENSGSWSIGDWIPACNGVKASSQVRAALDLWLNDHVTVPVYNAVQGVGANARYRLNGFAEFVLTSYNLQGNPKSVTGYFIRWVEGGPGGGSQGVRTIRLTM